MLILGEVFGYGEGFGVYLEGNRIRAVAPAGDLEARYPGARRVRVERVTPGIADAHAHPLFYGAEAGRLRLGGLSDPRAVAERVARHPGEGWVLGGGFLFAERPRRALLDAAGRGRPVYLKSRDLHAAWANEAAMRSAGLGPEDPFVDWEAGWVLERALSRLEAAAPKPGPEDLWRGLSAFAQKGYTAVHALAYEPPEALAWAEAEAERLPVRLWWALPRGGWQGIAPGWRGERLFVGGVKFFADGALGPATAWMHAPYAEGGTGTPLDALEAIEAEGREALAAGFTLAVHAIGTRAVAGVLEVFRRLPRLPGRPLRIEHLQHLRDADLALLDQAGVVASMQPVHLAADAELVRRRLPGREGEAFRFATVARRLPLAFGSDAPVAEPDLAASLREATGHRLSPKESLDEQAALYAHTRGAALAAGWGDYGRIAPGALADLGLFEGGRLVARVFDGALQDVEA